MNPLESLFFVLFVLLLHLYLLLEAIRIPPLYHLVENDIHRELLQIEKVLKDRHSADEALPLDLESITQALSAEGVATRSCHW